MIRLFLAALLIAALPAASELLAGEHKPTGLWLTEKKGLIVDLYECGEGRLCGRTVWMKKMVGKDGAPRLDVKNPDPALRDRHWCGIEVITGLEEKDGRWTGGKVYDPKTGQTFDFELSPAGERLEARGYLGVPLLGKTEVWTRAEAEERDFCHAPAAGA